MISNGPISMRAADSGCFISPGEAAGIGIPGMSFISCFDAGLGDGDGVGVGIPDMSFMLCFGEGVGAGDGRHRLWRRALLLDESEIHASHLTRKLLHDRYFYANHTFGTGALVPVPKVQLSLGAQR